MIEDIDFSKELIDTALSGKHTEETRINNYNEYLAAKEVQQAVYDVAMCFLKVADNRMTTYLKDENVRHLFEYRTMQKCYEYYIEEVEAAQRMIDEYRNYLFSGNIINAIILERDRRDYE